MQRMSEAATEQLLNRFKEELKGVQDKYDQSKRKRPPPGVGDPLKSMGEDAAQARRAAATPPATPPATQCASRPRCSPTHPPRRS